MVEFQLYLTHLQKSAILKLIISISLQSLTFFFLEGFDVCLGIMLHILFDFFSLCHFPLIFPYGFVT